MLESVNNYIQIIALYFPLGAIGVYRWSIWIVRKLVARRYRPIAANGYQNSLSIVVPVYNEDPGVFRKALSSWIHEKPEEIIAVIDYSDTTCIEIFREFQKEWSTLSLIVTDRPGKRQALADGIRTAQFGIIALVDSDTIWTPGIRDIVLAPFIDSAVGGVGPRQDVLDPNTPARRLFSMHLDHRYFDEMTYLATAGDALTCISGRSAFYRREAIRDLCYDLEHETFAGVRCISGDDKCLTRLIQEQGWKVRYQANAHVLTPGAPDLRTLLKQQLRWARNTFRSDMKSLANRTAWIWKHEKPLAYHMLDKFTQPFTLMLGPIFLAFSLVWGHYIVAAVLVAWWFVSRAIKLYPHFRRRPSDIGMLPLYLCVGYLMALLKIYALITIRKQGWITRWDKSRLGRLRFFASMPAYAGTIAVIVFLSFGIANYKQVAIPYAASQDAPVFSDGMYVDIARAAEAIRTDAIGERTGHYVVRDGDTVFTIAAKYHVSVPAIIDANSELRSSPDRLTIGQNVAIPVAELRNAPDWDALVPRGRPRIVLDVAANTIIVEGPGSVVNLSRIAAALGDTSALERLSGGEWIMRANVRITEDVTLVIAGSEVSWLKMQSDASGFVWLQSRGGSIAIRNTTITSWNERTGTPHDADYTHGRSYIFAQDDGRMDIENSELAYLGWSGERAGSLVSSGVYGVSWKASDDPLDRHLMTGTVTKSRFHDNYFGLYTYAVTGMLFAHNSVFENVKYGFDHHDGSNGIVIDDNAAYRNGDHGIIFSRHNFNNTITNNVAYENGLHGIMLHEGSDSTLVEHNTLYGNRDGIAVYNSHHNVIRGNEVRDNTTGVRVNAAASENYIGENTVMRNETGVFLYGGAHGNIVVGNTISGNGLGAYIKDAAGNLVGSSITRGTNTRDIEVIGNADNTIERIMETKEPTMDQ
jgi:hyaluronan synthase